MSILESRPTLKKHGQQGVVLIVALIMLMILSVLASISIRGASSTEQVANQSRQQALARQTAETALRFCEQQVQLYAANPATGFAPEAAPVGAGTPYAWETMANWDTLPAPSANLKTVAVTSAGDAGTNRVLKFDLNGNFLYSWGAPGPQPGRLNCPHGLSTDQNRNLYIADCFGGRVQKFSPQPNADPAKLVGQIFRFPVSGR